LLAFCLPEFRSANAPQVLRNNLPGTIQVQSVAYEDRPWNGAILVVNC